MREPLTLDLSAVVRREGDLYAATCPEYDVASEGCSVEEVLRKLKEAVELYLGDDDVGKPVGLEAPAIKLVRVDVAGSSASL